MKFSVASSLSYVVHGPSTLLCSLSCIRNDASTVANESLTASRGVGITPVSVGLAANRFSKIAIDEAGPLSIQYLAVVENGVEIHKTSGIGGVGIQGLKAESIPFLFPSRYAPSDQFRDLAAEFFGSVPTPFL